ncbi:MAG: transglutaminase family protein [Coriobacteriales bacterium]
MLALVLACTFGMTACASSRGGSQASGSSSEGTTSGPAWQQPAQTAVSSFDAGAATGANGALVDVSHANDGYVAASATADSRLKLLVERDDRSYNYDMPTDGTPLVAPVNMGDGSYTVRVMRNTNADRYVELCRSTVDVTLTSEFAPYLVPNCFCDYSESSACVAKAREICTGAENEGDVVRAVFDYVTTNVSYDYEKADRLSGTSGYVPDPDDTFSSGTGICLDYASLGAAMLRSQGIPAKIVTGNVSPSNVYHAWIMVYIDGSWKSVRISVSANTWSRVDLTFAATQDDDRARGYVGDGATYTDRYTY